MSEEMDEWDWYEEDLEGLDLEEQLDALLRPVPERPYPSITALPKPKPTTVEGQVSGEPVHEAISPPTAGERGPARESSQERSPGARRSAGPK